jgi:hypothetical protein
LEREKNVLIVTRGRVNEFCLSRKESIAASYM